MFAPGQRFRTNSLFVKLLFHFLIIIILLASYNLWSLNLYSRNAEKEIINHNLSLLKNTTETLENQFRSLKGLMFNLYHDGRVKALYQQSLTGDKRDYDYTMIRNLVEQIRNDVANPYYQLENLMVYYPSPALLLEKDGLVAEHSMFSRFYISGRYPFTFWQKQWKEGQSFSIFPGASFYNEHTQSSRTLMPVTAQTVNGDYHILAFVQVNKLMQAFSGTPQAELLLLDDNGAVIAASSKEADSRLLPQWDGVSRWLLHEDTYYFFEKGKESGATYVSVIPYKTLNATLQRLNWLAVLLFAVTLLIGITASFLFSRSIHRPVRDILAGFVPDKKPSVYHSKISEFNQIHARLNGLFQERNRMNQELNSSKSLLTNYGYITRFKKIDTGAPLSRESMIGEGSFILVLYRLYYRQGAMNQMLLRPEKAAARIREFIGLHIRQSFPESHTLQIESNEILSVVYTEERNGALRDSIETLKQTFDRDRQFYLVTVAVSSVFQQSTDFDKAYEETLMMTRQARPVEETQIFWELEQTEGHFMFTAEQEHEFFVNVQAGNDTYCIQLVTRMLEAMQKHRATSEQLSRFAEWLVVKTWKTMELLKAPCEGSPDDILAQLQDCITTEHYRTVLIQFISSSVRTVKVKREEQYDIIEFVMNYLENHYEEDISLEMLADKLNMSATYLSGYIKEKTGHNFTEHLNRLRIRTAKELLEKPELTIKEISERLGYSNSTSFIRMFKRWTGVPPGDYRKTLLFQKEHSR
ncbi:helix-turn-helix transcriptional regulator [Paenibacillus senegalensis]|uniref:helix-turn-helix transcriptional regulator n=1 Tax=Paenibacillus senegalensis TaxID=1465766 RepID=UPI0002880ADE|nr:AraC family transcriptional regulator [Paenibacillus senegalensis]